MHASYAAYEYEKSLRIVINKDDEYLVEFWKQHVEKMCELSKEIEEDATTKEAY